MRSLLYRAIVAFQRRIWIVYGTLLPWLYNSVSRCRYSGQSLRRLEIGSGNDRIEDFETLNVVPGRNVDYIEMRQNIFRSKITHLN